MSQHEFLVEIRIKDWLPDLKKGGRTLCYEEVVASDEYYARGVAFDQFKARSKHCPVIRRKIESEGLSLPDFCAPEAVQID